MTSFANLAQSLTASLPSTSAGASGASGRSSTDHEEPFVMSHILSNLLENMTMTSPLTSVATTPVPTTAASSSVTYDIWSVPPIPTSTQTPIGSSREAYNVTSNNNNSQSKEDNSSGSPGTSSSVASISCFRCEERSPTTRCLECNDLYCHECCHKPTSDCQLREHTLLPIHQISPIGARPSPNSINSANSGPLSSSTFNSGSLNSGDARRKISELQKTPSTDYDKLVELFYKRLAEQRQYNQEMKEKDRRWSMQKVVERFPGWNEVTIANLHSLFLLFDNQSNGMLGFDDFSAVLESLGDESTMEFRKEQFHEADTDNDGWITYDEFLSLVYNFNPQPRTEHLVGLARLCNDVAENIQFVSNLTVGEQLEYGLF